MFLPGIVRAEPDVTSAQVRAALPKLEALAKQTLEKTGVPGMAVVVVHRDEVVFLKGFGVREAGTDKLVDADTVFQLASMSKPFASTVLAALVGDGVIGWDDRLIDHLPGFRLSDPWVTSQVTIRDMLCHRSGLPSFAADELEQSFGYNRSEVLRRLRFYKLASSFRTQYAYTNFGLTAAAEAGARAAKQSWEALSAEKLYQPLGMKSTSSRFADYAAAPNRALLHVRVDGKWTAKYTRDPDAQAPAGGVSSTARDLSAWMRLHLAGGKFEGKQIIAANALAETHRPQILTGVNPATSLPTFYGLGWVVFQDEHGRLFWRHNGAFSMGARTEVVLLPRQQLGIAVVTNAFPSGIPEGMSLSFFDLVLNGKTQKDWVAWANDDFDKDIKMLLGQQTDYSKPPAKPRPALALEAYQGMYRNELYGDLTVTVKDDKLRLSLGRLMAAVPLQHWDRDLFVLRLPGDGGLTGAMFAIGGDGRASRVVVEEFDQHGQGTFVRVAAEDKVTNKDGVDTGAPKTHMVTVEPDVQLEVLDWGGSGPPLVLLTGLGNTAHIYTNFAHQFTDKFHVFAITRRGFGHSSKPARGYDVATRARDDIRVLDALKIPRAIFVGHSIAGDELSKLGADYPDRVVKLVYLDSVTYGGLAAVLKKTPLPPPPAPAAADLENLARVSAMAARYQGVRTPEEELRQHIKTDAAGHIQDTDTPAAYQAIQDLSQAAEYERIKAGVLAIWDVVTPESRLPYYWYLDQAQRDQYDRFLASYLVWLKDERQRFRTGIKHARVIELAKSHHYIFVRDEAAVVREMRKFLLEQ
jgi:CubicO group peptidase (beta-lactamase class C family)/pimeloyl-ACP methyl ester carboxylesterase